MAILGDLGDETAKESLVAKKLRMRKEVEAAALTGAGLTTLDAKVEEGGTVSEGDARMALQGLVTGSPLLSSSMKKAMSSLLVPPPAAPRIDVGATIHPVLSIEQRGQITTDKWQVVMVGAGGVGARLAPLLIKHLTNGDVFHIVDGDLVEAKNISRQHFTPNDIGVPKAQIVAQRARATAPREGIEVGFSPMMLNDVTLPSFVRALLVAGSPEAVELFGGVVAADGAFTRRSTILVTAVDTLKTRKELRSALATCAAVASGTSKVGTFIWIDCGNAVSSGQAMVMSMMFNYGAKVKIPGVGELPYPNAGRYVETWAHVLPGFLDRDDPAANPGDSCAVRIDPQTVLANSWAALAAASITVPIISMAGLRTMGINFSVTGSAQVAPLSQQVGSGGKLVSRVLA